ncbi:unnamed protein product [Closterium sp. NIES-53]
MLKDKRAAFLRQQERVQARTVVDHAAATAARRQAAPFPAAVAPASTAVAGEVAGSGKGIAVGFQGLQAENWLADAGKYEAVLRVRQLPLGQKIKKVIDLLFRVQFKAPVTHCTPLPRALPSVSPTPRALPSPASPVCVHTPGAAGADGGAGGGGDDGGRHHQPRAAGQPARQPQGRRAWQHLHLQGACAPPAGPTPSAALPVQPVAFLCCVAAPRCFRHSTPPHCPSDLPPTPSMLPPSHPPRLSLPISPPASWQRIHQAKHELAGRDDLLRLIREHKDGIPMGDVRDSYSGVAAHVQELRALGQAWVLFNADSGDEVLFPNDPRIAIKVDPDIRALFRRIDLPRDLTDLEKELQRCGQNPAMPAVRRLQALEGAMTAQVGGGERERVREKHAVPAVPAGLERALVTMVRSEVVEVIGGGSGEVGGMRHGRSAF